METNKEQLSQFFDIQASIQIFQGLHEIPNYARILVRVPGQACDFPFSKLSRPALGPTRSPIQWVLGSFLGGKAASHEIDHSTPCSVEAKNEWSCISALLYIFMA
jgi:hypothetical protein